MDATQYQLEAERTDLPDYLPVYQRISNEQKLHLIHYGMGMVTEAGEFIDMLKKHLMYGKPLDLVNLREEIGDILWYIARACTSLETTIEEEMERNNEKLKARFPEKFTENKAIERDLDKERGILERQY